MCSNILMKDHIASIFANYRPYAFVSRFCSCGAEQEESMCTLGGAGVGP